MGLSQFEKAVNCFQAELATPKPHPRTHYYDAIALQTLGRTDEAAAQFNQSLAQNPKDLDALYELAHLYMGASIATIQKLTDLDPDSFQIHALMGDVYANEGRHEESLKEYRAALAKRPDAPGLHYDLGTALRNLKQIDEAEKEFQAARAENPSDFGANQYLGEFAVGRHDYAGAVKYLQTASAARPQLARPHFLLGECYTSLGDPQSARSELLAAAQADPGDAQTHYLLSKVYRQLGDTPASAREMSEFQRLSLAAKEKTLQNAQTTPQ